MPRAYTVWQITDGRTGHERQASGLLSALGERVPLEVHTVPAAPNGRALGWWLRGRFPPGESLPKPQMVVGAGHRTHLSVLAARRAHGGRAVILMRPTLPPALFDLCIVPAHDGLPASERVFVTRGALNVMQPSDRREPGNGLMLIGGPSRHHVWSDAAVAEQVVAVCERMHDHRWTLTTSRRTPETLVPALLPGRPENLRIVPFEETGPEWLPQALGRAETVWVTEDSVSMVYEALTVGAATGVIEVRRQTTSKISRGLDQLAQAGTVTLFSDWSRGQALAPPPTPFNEAARCARWIHERWFEHRTPAD